VHEADRKEGFYWELPDGEKQNRCPRVAIKADPEWWSDIAQAYSSYEKGFLPVQGGLDDQPALFQPIMATVASALDDERDLAKIQRDRADQTMRREQQLNKAGKPGYAPIPTKGKR
jgi:hypothetical protein